MDIRFRPVREAFQELEGEGLITLRMNRGAVVNQIDRKFIRDIFEMRCLLEAEAAARAAQNGMETGELLERLLIVEHPWIKHIITLLKTLKVIEKFKN